MAKYDHFTGLTLEELPGVRLGSIPDKWRCKAKARSTGERCKAMRAKGQKVCRLHGAHGLPLTWKKKARLAARLRGERPPHYWCD